MNNLTQNNKTSEDQTLGSTVPPDDPQSNIKQPIPWWQFGVGFLGWFLVMWLVSLAFFKNSSPTDEYSFLGWGMLVFPIQILVVIILIGIKKFRHFGWGMVSALGINLVISLLTGVVFNGVCFVPFFID